MKIVQILPGSGGTFYCENCLRDTALVQALQAQGQDVILVPMYLPLYTDADVPPDAPVFFGGINVYLQQKFKLFRKTPRWLDRVLDSRFLLGLAAKKEGTTQANAHGAMTLSMLRGEDGNQAKELERLVNWLAEAEQPDIVHISSILLIGLARRIKEVLKVPVICSMQDEDTWIDHVGEDYAQACWDSIRQQTSVCDRLVTVSQYYRDKMVDQLGLKPEDIDVIPYGIDLDGYKQSSHPVPPVIGFLSKLTPFLGLELLVDAYMILKRREGLEDLQLRAMGGLNGDDKHFVKGLEGKLLNAGMAGDVQFLSEVDRASRLEFLSGLSVMSVPMPEGEAFGAFMAEAWAAGVPVVQPRVGAFPELVKMTGGGVIYDKSTPECLADALEPLLRDQQFAKELGEKGREATVREFGTTTVAQRMVSLYESIVSA